METLVAAFPDLINQARRKNQICLFNLLLMVVLTVAAVYFALDVYQLWMVWPLLFSPMWQTAMAIGGYAELVSGNLNMLAMACWACWNILRGYLGTSKRPNPQLSRALAVLEMIRAQQAPSPAYIVESDNESPEITGVAHPLGSVDRLAQTTITVWMGIGAIGLVWAGIGFALTSFQGLTSDLVTPTEITALHAPLLTWISAYRFVYVFSIFELLAVIFGVYMGVWALLRWRYDRIGRGGITARITNEGIQAQFLGARSLVWSARWDEIDGFALRRYRAGYRRDNEVYLLLAGENRVLLWEKPSLIPYAKPQTTARLTAERAAADRLIEQVMLHAPTALVDISKEPAGAPIANPYTPAPGTIRAILDMPLLLRWYQRFGWLVGLLLWVIGAGILAIVAAIDQPFR